jgi:hypothetical protein
MTVWLGAWKKNEQGSFLSTIHQHGLLLDDALICREDLMYELISFVANNWPDVFAKWQKNHFYEGGPDSKAAKTSIKVPWIDETYPPIPSRSGGEPHVVTRQGERFSCTCTAGSFNRECWAVAQIKRETGL